MVLPKRHPTGNKPKIKRGAERIDPESAAKIRREFEERKKKHPKGSVQAPPVIGAQAQPVQPVQQPVQFVREAQPTWPMQPLQQPAPQGIGSVWRTIIILLVILLAIIFLFRLISTIGGGFNGGGGGSCVCTCENGKVCTSNSQCPADTSVPGTYVPGVCGCPVGC